MEKPFAILKKLREMFIGEKVRITESINGAIKKRTVGVCKKIVCSKFSKNYFYFELADGSRYDFLGGEITADYVEGPSTYRTDAVRRFSIIKVNLELIKRIKEAFADEDGLYQLLDVDDPLSINILIPRTRMKMKPAQIADALNHSKILEVIADAEAAAKRDKLLNEYLSYIVEQI